MSGSWSCPACTLLNQPGHLACDACGQERPHNGAAAGGAATVTIDGNVFLVSDGEEEAPAGQAPWPAQAAGAAGGGGGRGACAYCLAGLPAWERWYCASCCSGVAAPWFACQECVRGKAALGGGFAGLGAEQRASKRQRLEGDRAEPCFDAAHRFEPVVPGVPGMLGGDVRVVLEPGPAAGKAERVEWFLSDYRPADAPMGISWIQVHSGRRSEVEVRAEAKEAAAAARGGQSEGERAMWARQAWELAKQRGGATADAALQAGRDWGILGGKWLLFPSPATEDAVWGAVVKAVYQEGLCPAAKIAAGPKETMRGARVICVYTNDFDDREDVMRVHRGLGAALAATMGDAAPRWKIHYKPDIMTYLDIYSKKNPQSNPLGIKVTLYSAQLGPGSSPAAAGAPPAAAAAAAAGAAGEASAGGSGWGSEEQAPAAGAAAAGAAPAAPPALDPRAAAAAAALARAASRELGGAREGGPGQGPAGPAAGGSPARTAAEPPALPQEEAPLPLQQAAAAPSSNGSPQQGAGQLAGPGPAAAAAPAGGAGPSSAAGPAAGAAGEGQGQAKLSLRARMALMRQKKEEAGARSAAA